MCGRFSLAPAPGDLGRLYELPDEVQVEDRYNIAPTQRVAIVRASREDRTLELVRWGLIPSWSREGTKGKLLINARSETAHETPSFRAAWQARRCIIPATGFYEWSEGKQGKEPHYFSRQGGGLLSFAGLWETWTGPDGAEVQSCAILTTASGWPVALHHNRMPVILKRDDYATWLDPDLRSTLVLQPLMVAVEPGVLADRRVSSAVNAVRNQGPDLIKPV